MKIKYCHHLLLAFVTILSKHMYNTCKKRSLQGSPWNRCFFLQATNNTKLLLQRHLLICHTELRLLCNHVCELSYYQSIKKADRWKTDENRDVVFIWQEGEIHGSKQEATIEGILLPTLCRQRWSGIRKRMKVHKVKIYDVLTAAYTPMCSMRFYCHTYFSYMRSYCYSHTSHMHNKKAIKYRHHNIFISHNKALLPS